MRIMGSVARSGVQAVLDKLILQKWKDRAWKVPHPICSVTNYN